MNRLHTAFASGSILGLGPINVGMVGFSTGNTPVAGGSGRLESGEVGEPDLGGGGVHRSSSTGSATGAGVPLSTLRQLGLN
jgi:hypothetical protein